MFLLSKIWGNVLRITASSFKQRRVRRSSAAVLFFLLITIVISVGSSNRVNLQEGQVSPRNIMAPRSIVFEDKIKTEENRQQAASKEGKQYTKDLAVTVAVQKDISTLMSSIRSIQADSSLTPSAKMARIKALLPFSLPDSTLGYLSRALPETTQQVEGAVLDLITKVFESEKGVNQDNLEEVKKNLALWVKQLHFNEPNSLFAQTMVNFYLRPNAFYDPEKTEKMQEIARKEVAPVRVTVKQGEKIIGEGEIVTKEHLSKLQALGLLEPRSSIASLVGNALLVALLIFITLFYLYQQNKEIYRVPGHLYLLGIIVTVILAVSRANISVSVSQWPEFEVLLGYTAPLGAAGMLITILLDYRIAILSIAMMSFLLGFMTGGQLQFALVGFIGGITGIYSVSKLSQRGDLVRAGVYTGSASAIAIFIMGLIAGLPIGLIVSSSLILGAINGVLSSILTNGALPFLESTFGITSSVRLLELSNPNNILLKRLLIEAPGTYHHSIIVGNLAEAAADAVGGDSLLARVGAYYHDIGKIKRPYFFIENQMSCENPHKKIAPSLSMLILASHVKDGVEMAKESRLPPKIIDFIEQHHGCNLVSFFYHKALENSRTDQITEEEYRYEGPKPQTRELAIVMLADSVEAAVHSLQNPTPGRVEGLVRKIIKEKLMDGQLDECDLTFKDLNIIAGAFVQVLSGIFHSRIEYPDMVGVIEGSRTKNGGVRKQPARKSASG